MHAVKSVLEAPASVGKLLAAGACRADGTDDFLKALPEFSTPLVKAEISLSGCHWVPFSRNSLLAWHPRHPSLGGHHSRRHTVKANIQMRTSESPRHAMKWTELPIVMLGIKARPKRQHAVPSIDERYKDRPNHSLRRGRAPPLGEAVIGAGASEGRGFWGAGRWLLMFCVLIWGPHPPTHGCFLLVRLYPAARLGYVHFSECRLDFNKKFFLS